MRKNWEYKKFKDVFNLQMGKTPDRKNYDLFQGSNIWVSIRDLGDKYISSSNEYISDKAASNIKMVPKGTVIMSFKLSIGKCAIAAKDLYTNEAIMAFNIKDGHDIDSSFLYYYLQGYKWSYANKAVMGITLNKAIISKHIIGIPPKSTQLAIVAELDKLNEMIRLKKQQLEDYDQLAQSIFYEMFGDPVENEKEWEVKKLGEVCIDITDGDHMPPPKASKGIPFITISNINKETRELNFENTFFVSVEYYNNLKDKRKARKGDLIYTVTGSYGIPVTVETNIPFCFQRHIALIRPKQNVLSTKYLCFWVLCENVKSMADRAATGIAQKTVGLNTIRNFMVILPPLPLQQQFAARIEAIEQQKQQVKDKIKDLETLLASRMQ
mgnify:FL=1